MGVCRNTPLSTLSGVIVLLTVTGLVSLCRSGDARKDAGTAGAPNQIAADAQENKTALPNSVSGNTARQNRKLIVYYFHGNVRCHNCIMIENLTRQAVNTGFADQLKSGRVELKVVNIEEPGNGHFAEDYKLYTKSVILSDIKDGKEANWKNLDQVWTRLYDENKFIDYIQSEVQAFL